MPKRTDIGSILVLGAGPIVIGQACEFDYSGAQACKALKAEGYRVILVNSNPATIMTDPELADATYVEPLIPEVVERIIERERPDALLPTLGGQTGLNLAMELARSGVLERYGVEMIGANADVIEKAESRQRFREAMERIGIECPCSQLVSSVDQALAALERVGLPAIILPSFTLGGEGGGIATTRAELIEAVERGLTLSGGQRQRVSIARALLVDPRVLILDDATASVDATTESRIRRALETVMEGRTTIIITHRLGLARRADLVVVLTEPGAQMIDRPGRRREARDRSLHRHLAELLVVDGDEYLAMHELLVGDQVTDVVDRCRGDLVLLEDLHRL